ncbi:hypothetical protein Taro_043859 [Colocasia esculenta]|uniref:Uncharacterized protein n=1 Tax=Colocasia esculenta TaxID=4460 RepID=A0A843WSF6_COLES|nr:hypothetical protein [Colocasia esculenta]
MAGTVVVFDFDKTIIDCDSDNWVVDGLGATELFERLLPAMPWNTLMDTMMAELHARGKSIEDIEGVLKTAPLDPRIAKGIKTAHALGCELKIVSDANTFFIETILKHHGLIGYFSEINTNPSYVDEEGRLRISPYHDFHRSSHGCPLCPPNMCKSAVVERIQSSAMAEGKKRIIYLGDGKGDYCPSLRLTESDHVMPRKNYPLWELISEDPSRIKAQVHEWSNGEEQERTLLQIIQSLLLADGHSSSQQLLSVDCKLETIPMAAHDPVLQALPVPH